MSEGTARSGRLAREFPSGVRVSVVVPVLNEAAALPGLLDHLRGQLRGNTPRTALADQAGLVEHEVIVVDGGSSDGSQSLCEPSPFGRSRAGGECETQDAGFRLRLVSAPVGRAVQMNAGAAAATGDVLLFLHADCRLGAGAIDALKGVIERTPVVGGAFRHRIAGKHWLLRVIEFGDNLRAGCLGLYYGDQGIFCRRTVFQRMGGWPEIPLMEEYPFCRALRREGPVRLLRRTVYSSDRRWRAAGIVRTTLRNWSLVARYLAGVAPERLAREYPMIR